MRRLKWIVIVLALVEAGWLAFDGAHAFVVGDYVTPSTGAHAGQLGPWSKVVSGVGLEPRSTLMMAIHLVLGSAWLLVTACFAFDVTWARAGMIVCAVLGLWYLPFGTFLSVLQIVLLTLPSWRGIRVA